MGKLIHFQGLRRRWLVNSTAIVLLLMLLIVAAFSLIIADYYYKNIEGNLRARAATSARFLSDTDVDSMAAFTTRINWYAADFDYKSRFATLIAVDLKEYAKYLGDAGKSVRKNITIPAWLSERADEMHINYSSVLQEALKEHLGL